MALAAAFGAPVPRGYSSRAFSASASHVGQLAANGVGPHAGAAATPSCSGSGPGARGRKPPSPRRGAGGDSCSLRRSACSGRSAARPSANSGRARQRRKNDRKGWLEKRAAANRAAGRRRRALGDAGAARCAAIVIKGARTKSGEGVNGLYRASESNETAVKGAHLVAKRGTWADPRGLVGLRLQARGWATSTTVNGASLAATDFLVAGRGGFQLQWLRCDVSARSLAADDASSWPTPHRRRRAALRQRAT